MSKLSIVMKLARLHKLIDLLPSPAKDEAVKLIDSIIGIITGDTTCTQ